MIYKTANFIMMVLKFSSFNNLQEDTIIGNIISLCYDHVI